MYFDSVVVSGVEDCVGNIVTYQDSCQGEGPPEQSFHVTGHQLVVDDLHDHPGERDAEEHRNRNQAESQDYLALIGQEVSESTPNQTVETLCIKSVSS